MSPRTTARRTLRAIIYIRVSSYDLAAEEAANSSPDVQRARSLARVTAEGWELATEIGDGGVIYDLDESGSDKGMRLNRPGLLIARNAIKARKADVIVSLRLDRLARNTIDLLMLADELEQHGGAFALAEGDINTAGPYGKLILTIIAAIAEMEAKMITARTMAGKVAAFEQGRWIGTRFVPFGFMKVAHPSIKDAWTLAHNPETAPIVKEVVRLVRDENATSYGIAQWLNDQDVPTVNGKVGGWRPNTVREMFTHEIMVGRSFWQGDVLRDENGLPRTVFPPLVDVNTWRLLKDRFRDTKAGRNRGNKANVPRLDTADSVKPRPRGGKYLLAGVASRCSNCGGTLSACPDSQGYKRYRCDLRTKGTCKKGVSIRVETLDDIVTEEFIRIIGHMRIAEETVVEEHPNASRRADLADALRVARAALADAVEAEDDSTEAAARVQVKALRAELDNLPLDASVRRERVWSSETYAERFARLDVRGRRELLAPLVRVTVGPAVIRTETGRYDISPEAIRQRVTIDWLDELVDAAVDALDPFEPEYA